MSLARIIDANLAARPDAPAVFFKGNAWSHAGYARRVARLAHWLRHVAHVPMGARVAVLAQNCVEYIECYGVSEQAGLVLVTLNYRLSAAELGVILDDCRPMVLVFAAEFEDTVALLKERPGAASHHVCIGDVPGVAPAAWAVGYEAIVADDAGGVAAGFDAGRQVPDDSSTAYLVYTSGSTGRPKGVMLQHGGQMAAARILAASQQLTPDDKLLLTMPLYHAGGRSMQMAYFHAGASVLVHERFDPERFCRDVQDHRVTGTLLAPTMIMAILQWPGVDQVDLGSLRTIVYSAAAMPSALLRAAIERFGKVFMQYYGLTETGPLGTMLRKEAHFLANGDIDSARLPSAGQASDECEVVVVDDTDRPVPTGVAGEVLIKAPSMMSGYWNDPAATAIALRGGWMHTGDVGYLDADGFLFIVDRKKDMIISGGENIYPREVEEALYAHPAVMDAAVIGVPHDKWGETVKAIVVRKPSMPLTEAEVIAHCRERIASYKKPTSVDFVEALARLPSGKINKPLIRETYRKTHRETSS